MDSGRRLSGSAKFSGSPAVYECQGLGFKGPQKDKLKAIGLKSLGFEVRKALN